MLPAKEEAQVEVRMPGLKGRLLRLQPEGSSASPVREEPIAGTSFSMESARTSTLRKN